MAASWPPRTRSSPAWATRSGHGHGAVLESGRGARGREHEAAPGVLSGGGRRARRRLDTDTGAGMLDVRIARHPAAHRRPRRRAPRAEQALARRDMGSDDATFVQAHDRPHRLAGRRPRRRAGGDSTRPASGIDRRGPVLAQYAHGKAMVEAQSAIVAADTGDLDEADRRLAAAFPAASGTSDMPVIAMVGVGGGRRGPRARPARRSGRAARAAAAAVRGADPRLPAPEALVRLARRRPVRRAYARGRALSREDALARLEAPGQARRR